MSERVIDRETIEIAEGEESFADRAYRGIEELIVSLQVEPGAVLTEQGLSAMLGLGRTPIREALQRLAREHLVVIMPRRGIRVTEMRVAEQLKVLEVRRELERYVAVSAARRATPEEKAGFVEMAELMTEAAAQGDDVSFLRLDREFNVFAAQCARNAYAEAAIAPLHALSRRFWTLHLRQAGGLPEAAAVHAAIMRAIAASDEAAAAQATDRLLDWARNFTAKTTVP
jgi:DNA-binding GntR family transcriptional regulator